MAALKLLMKNKNPTEYAGFKIFLRLIALL